MSVSFDPAKRAATLAARGLDFVDAEMVIDGRNTTYVDERVDYGEERLITVGWLRARMVVLVWHGATDAGILSRSGRRTSVSNDDTAASWADPDDAPELTEAWFDKAHVFDGGRLVKRGTGRPVSLAPKRQVTLRLDAEVVGRFRAAGPGWQTRINAALRTALGL